MKQFFKFFFASFLGSLIAIIVGVFLVLAMIIGIASSVSNMNNKKEGSVSENSILHLTLDKPIVERGSNNPLNNFDFASFSMDEEIGLDVIIENINKAKTDDNIKGILLDLSFVNTGLSNLTEIRNALLDFKKSGKFIYSYGEYVSQGSYLLTSVSDSIFINPEGAVIITGFKAEIMFFQKTLEKLGIEPIIIRHGSFKSAVEPFISDKMSNENRLQTKTLVNDLWSNYSNAICASRKIERKVFQNVCDSLLIESPESLLKYKIIDKVYYKDQVYNSLKNKLGIESSKKLNLITLNKYSNIPKKDEKYSENKIAVIYFIGQIVSGEGDQNSIGSDNICKAIIKAKDDSKVKAIVLRINSPGGSALASEVILREIQLAKKEKPVIVSMGDVAASGGYYIACYADTIVANPTTITGSIGVFGLYFNAKELLNNKLGITIDTVKSTKYADLGSFTRPATDYEKIVLQKAVNRTYNTFINHVSKGRNIKTSYVDSIGQGRVWSGVKAKEIGLVDVLGGLNDAIEIARKKAKLEDYRIVTYPKVDDLFEEVSKMFGENKETMIEEKLGIGYKYFNSINNMVNKRGVQTILPYEINVN